MDPPATKLPHVRPQSFSTHPFEFYLSWAILIVLSPIIVPFVITIYTYRMVVRFLAQNYFNLSSPLTPYDCIFAVDSYHTRPYASNLTVLELTSRLDISTLKQIFKTKILDNPAFAKLKFTPVEFMGYWFWKDIGKTVNLDECVTLYHDSELESNEKNIDECLKNIVEMPFKNELFNVCLLNFGRKSILVFRIHHTVCDGYSFNHLIDTFVGLESKYLVRNERMVKDTKKNPLTEFWSEMKRVVMLLLHLPLHISTLYRESLTHTPNFYTLPKTSTTGTIRRTVLPLSQIKRLRQFTNSHFASIGMSLMTGALQKLYDEGPLNARPEALRPERLSIMHSLPKPNHPLKSLCNHWGVGLFKIPFVRNSVGRMYGAEDDFNEYLRLQFDKVLHIHIPVVGLVPTWVVKWFFSINFGTSCGFTSVPGLFDRVAYIGGGSPRLDDGDGGVLEGGNGVEVAHMWKVFGLQWRQSACAVAMYTYRGEASVSIYANKDIIPDDIQMDRLLELFHAEFNELVEHTNSKALLKQQQQLNGISANNTTTPTPTPAPPLHLPSQNGFNFDKELITPTPKKLIDSYCIRNNKLA